MKTCTHTAFHRTYVITHHTVWYSLVRWIGLLSHYNRTAPEFVFNRVETTSFKRSRTDCFGADPSAIAVFTYAQTNRANGGNVGMADAKRHGVEIPKHRCFETLLWSVIRNTRVTWLRRFEASGRVTSVWRRGIPANSAFDWQGREQITQLHICLNLTPTKYKSGVASSLRGFLWEDRDIVIFIV